MTGQSRVEVRLECIDCAGCATAAERSLRRLPRVADVKLFAASQKAVLLVEGAPPSKDALRRALEDQGCRVAAPPGEDLPAGAGNRSGDQAYGRSILIVLGFVVSGIVLVAVVGDWLGLFGLLERYVPWPVGWAAVALGGYPVFRQTIRAALHREITAGTLMTFGALISLATGQWPVALILMAFMRVSNYVEVFTGDRSRRALRELLTMVPRRAIVERDGKEVELPLGAVQAGDIVVVRPGSQIPVDGVVVSGRASLDKATITGESMPVEVSAGDGVLAVTTALDGSLRVRAERIGEESMFGRIVRLVGEAEGRASKYQRLADRVATYYLPLIVLVAAATFLISRSVPAMVAVLVVACPCAFACVTPVAVLASVGGAAKHGLVIKGGKYLELLTRVDVVLLDKTGTLTLGRPVLTDVVPTSGNWRVEEIVRIAASAERYSEHPLAGAIRTRATELGIELASPEGFVAFPGAGVRADVEGRSVVVGNEHLVHGSSPEARRLLQDGKTVLHVQCGGTMVGLLGVSDELRPEARDAVAGLRDRGIERIEILTGDNEQAAALIARQLGTGFRAGLLPHDKVDVVRSLQADGRRVVMIGDGVNDAPALAQADVGIAMGAVGSDVAIEAADIALMREDWRVIPRLFDLAWRTTRVIRGNLLFTLGFDALGVALAALGILPPVLAAASQSLPDLAIVGNSARLLGGAAPPAPSQAWPDSPGRTSTHVTSASAGPAG